MTPFSVINTNSVNYAALQPIMLQSKSIMLPYTTHYATIKVNHAALYNPLCYNQSQSCCFTTYYATIRQNHTMLHLMLTMVTDALAIMLNLLYHLQWSILQQTLYIHAAQDKQQSIQYNAAMMLYHKLTVCQTLQTQSHKARTINQT